MDDRRLELRPLRDPTGGRSGGTDPPVYLSGRGGGICRRYIHRLVCCIVEGKTFGVGEVSSPGSSWRQSTLELERRLVVSLSFSLFYHLSFKHSDISERYELLKKQIVPTLSV